MLSGVFIFIIACMLNSNSTNDAKVGMDVLYSVSINSFAPGCWGGNFKYSNFISVIFQKHYTQK